MTWYRRGVVVVFIVNIVNRLYDCGKGYACVMCGIALDVMYLYNTLTHTYSYYPYLYK